jgi:methionyl-tRNA formyltransferase
VKVLLAGEGSAGIGALELVREHGHRPVAVLTSSRGSGTRTATVAGVARAAGVPVRPAGLVTDHALATRIEEDEVDLLLNVHSLHIAHPAVITAPGIGSFNLHPGPLPEYAGLNVPSWAVLHGEERHGVTLHWIAPRVDAGPIAYEERFEIGPGDSGLTVSAECVRRGLRLIERLLEDAAADPSRIPRVPQELSRRRYFGREVPFGGRLPWSERARVVADFVRASDYSPFPSPWGHPKASIAGRELEVLRAARTGAPADEPPGTVGEASDEGVRVAAADEWILLQRVRHAGRSVDPSSLLTPGERFETEVAPLGG